ncbi:MAG: DUF1501 domain-containing protein [Acidobacteria bacterium]|nr:DUF1501 domain-containing protein [Acidobacteriota bacterium]
MRIDRRNFLGAGFASLGVAALEAKPHFAAKAKRVVFLFMNGGPSQVDTFDYKPELTKWNGKPYKGPLTVGSNGRAVGYLMQSPFEFKPRGKSGLMISDLFPHTSKFADDLCVIRSMHADTAAHASGCLQMNSGSIFIGKPSIGAWVTYGLGSGNDNLPAYVVMTDPRGGPIGSASNWSAGFMPAKFQGTLFRSTGAPLLDLRPPVDDATQRRSLDLLKELNQKHLDTRDSESELAARMQSYELAYRMQTEAASTVDIDRESPETRARYGVDDKLTADFGRKCLITRRLLEKGVRFVQLYSGGGHIEDTWDGHNDCITNHKLHAGETDKPIAALMEDLKATGLWDETMLLWGGEFGRTPTSEGVGKPGRDHDWHGFSMWLAGAGIKGGQAIGATDELGFEAVEGRVHVSDLHATLLHAIGFDHTRLTLFHQGMNQRLTGVRGEVVRKVFA